MTKYINSVKEVNPSMLEGFFEGWISPPSREMRLTILKNSYAVILALDDTTGKVVGFITSISDGVHAAHITLFEVLPQYRRKGIGSELLKRMLADLKDLYGISLMCDKDLQPFYTRFNMSPGTGMNLRNYNPQINDD